MSIICLRPLDTPVHLRENKQQDCRREEAAYTEDYHFAIHDCFVGDVARSEQGEMLESGRGGEGGRCHCIRRLSFCD